MTLKLDYVTLTPKICPVCNNDFVPKPRGYNAIYCSKKCKSRIHRPRSYTRIKQDPSRYSKHLASVNKSATKVREWLAEYKVNKGCIDCGYNKNAAALQLDHTLKKTIPISEARSSITRLINEIENGGCVVRCAVCHAVKTWAVKSGLEYRPEMAR